MVFRYLCLTLLSSCCLLTLQVSGQRPPPPPPPPPKIVCSDLFRTVDEMPMFYYSACATLEWRQDRESCGRNAMHTFIRDNLRYPVEACLPGTCVVAFVVEEDGSLTDIHLIRDFGFGSGTEAVKVVEKMAAAGRWVPGRHCGRTVRVLVNLSIPFSLE